MSTELTMTNEEAQRHVEALMRQYNLRGLVWGEIDLDVRVEERLENVDASFILPEGVTRADIVKKAQEMPSWAEDSAWCDGQTIPWEQMADAVEEALVAICGVPA